MPGRSRENTALAGVDYLFEDLVAFTGCVVSEGF
jgi:hypothetical protein